MRTEGRDEANRCGFATFLVDRAKRIRYIISVTDKGRPKLSFITHSNSTPHIIRGVYCLARLLLVGQCTPNELDVAKLWLASCMRPLVHSVAKEN